MRSVEYYLRLPYTVQVVPDVCTDGSVCYVARAVELPGCESHGDTPEEAVISLAEAQRLYIETMIEDGVEPPIPAEQAALFAVWRMEPASEKPAVLETETLSLASATFETV